MDLFETSYEMKNSQTTPLYSRIRPKELKDFMGQNAIKPFLDLIYKDRFPSTIIWGPPGSGKTTFANIIKNMTQKDFVFLSAVLSGKKEVMQTVERAKNNLKFKNKQTILFIDEIHRFNKAQQDALLPHLEDGTFVLIGATTENPGFEIIPALLSRCKVLAFMALEPDHIISILEKVVKAQKLEKRTNSSGLRKIANLSQGDARFAINLLETCLDNVTEEITDEVIDKLLGEKKLRYDKNGDNHYNFISAFIKSVRGSDPDASVYYLARMLESGEDPKFIARRLIILASEDIGNADPRALGVSVAAFDAIDKIGMPEARIVLSQATIYLATAPKSNAAYLAIDMALNDVRCGYSFPPPLHLRNPVNSVLKGEGYGKNYKYAHDYPHNIINQEHLPHELKGKKYYNPTQNGYEKNISERITFWKQVLKKQDV